MFSWINLFNYLIGMTLINVVKDLMSTKTGLNPFIITEFISETQVKVGTIISFLFVFVC
jgi:hypothetical protein